MQRRSLLPRNRVASAHGKKAQSALPLAERLRRVLSERWAAHPLLWPGLTSTDPIGCPRFVGLLTDAIPRRTHGNPALQNALHACVIGPERHLLRDSNGLELGVKRKGWRALKTSLMTHSSFLASIESPPHHQLTTSRPRGGVWPIIQFDFTGSVRNRSLEGIKGGSFITEIEVCCPSSISRKFPIALVMFSLNFAPA